MKADALNANSLFDGKVQYEIPPFQRPYVWEEESQWAPLWADIVRVADSVVRAGSDPDALKQVPNHFLGAIVYESRPPVVGDVTRHLVIDGQQRTTTLQVLIDAVQQVIAERGHDLMAEDLESLILNKSSAFKNKPERFKLWPSRVDRAAFAQAMDPQPQSAADDHRIVAAHAFFRAEAAEWLVGEPDPDGVAPPGTEEERVLGLCSTLQHRLLVVAINLTGHEDSQLIFETLNDRGTPLLKADLIKNWVFREGDRLGADVESWPETYWSDFDDDWWRAEIAQGRHQRSRIDIFLQYWLTMRLRDEVIVDEVFRRFTEYAAPYLGGAGQIEALLTELRHDADTFRQFAELDPGSPEGTFYQRVIETMELAATTPLLLWMLSANHHLPADQVAVGLQALESWVIRRTLLRYTMKDVNKLMVALLRALDEVPQHGAGDAVRAFLAAQTSDARIWPGDQTVVRQLPTIRMYGSIRQGRLRVVLEAIEMRLRTERHEAVALPPWLEIEHVMPQGWRTHWDTEPKLTQDEAWERDARVNQLGNLTLVTKKLNGALAHRPWTDAEVDQTMGTAEAGKGKRSLLGAYSLLALSSELTTQHPDAWTEDDIVSRSELLATRICEVWPGPGTIVEPSADVVPVPGQADPPAAPEIAVAVDLDL